MTLVNALRTHGCDARATPDIHLDAEAALNCGPPPPVANFSFKPLSFLPFLTLRHPSTTPQPTSTSSAKCTTPIYELDDVHRQGIGGAFIDRGCLGLRIGLRVRCAVEERWGEDHSPTYTPLCVRKVCRYFDFSF
jgi:hypothetical protein